MLQATSLPPQTPLRIRELPPPFDVAMGSCEPGHRNDGVNGLCGAAPSQSVGVGFAAPAG